MSRKLPALTDNHQHGGSRPLGGPSFLQVPPNTKLILVVNRFCDLPPKFVPSIKLQLTKDSGLADTRMAHYSSELMPGRLGSLLGVLLAHSFFFLLPSLLLTHAQCHPRNRGTGMQVGENRPLQVLFWQVCRLLSVSITPIYVFDGPERPSTKRDRKVKTAPHALMRPYQELIKRAGFHSYVVRTCTYFNPITH